MTSELIEAQRTLNILVSVRRYLCFIARDTCAEDIVDKLTSECVGTTDASIDLAHDYSEKWLELDSYLRARSKAHCGQIHALLAAAE